MPNKIRRSLNRNTALQHMQEKNSYSKIAAECLKWSYYDSFSMLSTTLTHTLFVTGTGTGKNLSQTNMPTSGQLPQGQSFTIREIQLLYSSLSEIQSETSLLGLYEMFCNSTLEFKVTGKDSLLTVTLQELMGSVLQFIIVPSVPGDNISQIQPWFKSCYKLDKFPITIGATQSFSVEINHHGAPSSDLDNDKVKIVLRGDLERLS